MGRESDAYNPYLHRTDGSLNNLLAFFHLIKCSIGSGILASPSAFKNAGMYGGFIIGIVTSIYLVYAFLVLIKTMVKISAELQVPYASLQTAVQYSFNNSHECLKCFSKVSTGLIDILLCLSYLGTCSIYYNFVVATTLSLSGYKEYSEGKVNAYRSLTVLIWFVPFSVVNCCRNLKSLAPCSFIGNTLIMGSVMMVIGFIMTPGDAGFSDTWVEYGDYKTAPLFIGELVFSIGSFGINLAVERDMEKPRGFVGLFGLYSLSMTLVVIWYLAVGFLGYFKYGDKTESTIVFTIPPGTWLSIMLQVTVSLALFCSYPLMCFVTIDLIWNQRLAKCIKNHSTIYEYLFRIFITAVTGVTALLVPRLDLILSLTGALTMGCLALVLPGVIEYNYTYGKHGWSKPFLLIKDILMLIFGTFCLVAGVYAPVYGIIKASK